LPAFIFFGGEQKKGRGLNTVFFPNNKKIIAPSPQNFSKSMKNMQKTTPAAGAMTPLSSPPIAPTAQ
jgi:hypothetical protein